MKSLKDKKKMKKFKDPSVIGCDLNHGAGFESVHAALNTIDPRFPCYGSQYIINYEIYELVNKKGKIKLRRVYEED